MVKFVKVNVDLCPELKERYQIYAVPTLKDFRDGKLFYNMNFRQQLIFEDC